MAREEYYEYEEHRRVPRRDRDRDPSPDYHSGGGGLAPPGSSASRNDRPRSVPPPNTSIVPRPRSRRDSFDSLSSTSSYYDHNSKHHKRSRSVAPRNGERGGRDRDESPVDNLDRARLALGSTFTHTPTGIGASLLGAVVGGFAAREASNAAQRRKHSHEPPHSAKEERNRAVSTVLGALAGGLGANAIANKVEESRVKDRQKQRAWERKWGSEEDLPHCDDGKGRDRGRRLKDRESDEDDYDFVYDERDRRRRSGGEDARYRY